MKAITVILFMFYLLLMTSAAIAQEQPGSQPESLVIALGKEPDSGFDPIYGWGKYNNPLFQSSLIKRNSQLALIDDIAKQWTLSEDKIIWAIEIKSHLLFSDGKALTSDDIKFTFDKAKASASIHDLTNLDEVIIKSPTSLIFRLKHPDINFIDNFINLAIVPKHIYAKGYGQHPVGSGPYQFVRWDKGQQLLLAVNPHYYGEKPQFEQLTIVFSDEDSRYARLMAGQLQLASIAPRYASLLPRGFKLWSINSVDNRGIAWPMVKASGDIGNDVTADLAIRTAIDLVIDRNILVNQLLDGHATPAYSISDGLPWGSGAEIDNGVLVTRDRESRVNLDKAQQLLDEAGWLQKGAVRQKQGLKAAFSLYYLAGDSIREQLALTVAQMVKPLGISVTPRGESWETIYKHMHSQPVLFGFGSHSASEVRYVHHSQYRGVEYFNAGYYSNPLVDKALDDAQHSLTWEDSLPYWQAAQRLIEQDRPWSWLVNLKHLYAAHPCLDLAKPGIEPHGHGWPLANNISEWRWLCH
ncbi:ABC transporter substrate-binding protein [Shewanella sp. UCD-KL12]|uniref:ABC transporter substrate-binding protein n=1 Tax=Shewanella sp. UCD-KL12 TaxID=1917163 RepID=UPI0009706FF9|nr:ABC transporter substrate-binding protein [Shewanella sp. UCD-KL12]